MNTDPRHLIFMATSGGGEEKKNGCMFLAGNLQAASNKEVFEEIRKTAIVVCKVVFCLALSAQPVT